MSVHGTELCDSEDSGAGDGIRTRDINLGKVALYQLSYSRSPVTDYIVALPLSIVKNQMSEMYKTLRDRHE